MLFSLFWLLWPLLYGACALGVGTMATANETVLLHSLSVLAGCLLPARGVWYLVLARRNRTRLRPNMLVQTGIEAVLALAIIFLPRFSYRAYLIFLVLYFSFHMTVQGINAVIYGRNRVFQYFIPALCQAALFFLLFLGLIFLPDGYRRPLVLSGSGWLLSMLGQAYLCDWLSVIIKNRRVAGAFRRISVTMPGFSGLGVPARLVSTLGNDRPAWPPDAEVIFNYGKHGKGLAGHCELCVGGRTYTYGNYDPGSRAILKTMGNGIIFRAEKERYIDFLVAQGRTVVVYGLKFKGEQREVLRQNLLHFEETLSPWTAEAGQTLPEEYIHRVLTELGADVYRIDEGRFKTYFLPTINCVTLTGSLLRGTAAGNIVVPGVYTPGAYMDSLHRLYVAGNDVVASVNTYNA